MSVTTQTTGSSTRTISGVECVALLCPGPSLPQTWSNDLAPLFGLVVAVNTAGFHFVCDYMFGLDEHIVRPILKREFPPPRISLITSNRNTNKARDLKIPAQPIVRLETGTRGEKCAWTMPNALSFSLSLGKHVEIHGMDFSNTLDFNGTKGCHKAVRWKQEADWLRRVWRPDRITVYGKIPQPMLDYIEGRAKVWPWP
jgi:hypothetical protein